MSSRALANADREIGGLEDLLGMLGRAPPAQIIALDAVAIEDALAGCRVITPDRFGAALGADRGRDAQQAQP